MCQTDKCVVAQGLKVVFIINLIIIDHSIMIQAFRFIEISKYDDGGQLMTTANLCLEAVYGQLGPLQIQPILKLARFKVGPLQSEHENNSIIFIFMYKI